MQQVSVVAGELYDLARGSETPTAEHRLRVLARVREPALGKRRKVNAYIGKNRFAVHVLLHLDQEAPSADENAERVEGLRSVELFGFQAGFAKR